MYLIIAVILFFQTTRKKLTENLNILACIADLKELENELTFIFWEKNLVIIIFLIWQSKYQQFSKLPNPQTSLIKNQS